MRIFSFAVATRNRAVRGVGWIVTGLLVAGVVTIRGAETGARRAERLGYRFDPQAHAVAVAAEQRRKLDLGPLDPGVVRLPDYEVVERAIPLREHELLTPEGRLAVAKKRYLAPIYQKTLGPVAAVAALLANPLGGWSPNNGEAMALYEDGENLRRRTEMNELSELAGFAERVRKSNAASRRPGAESPEKP